MPTPAPVTFQRTAANRTAMAQVMTYRGTGDHDRDPLQRGLRDHGGPPGRQVDGGGSHITFAGAGGGGGGRAPPLYAAKQLPRTGRRGSGQPGAGYALPIGVRLGGGERGLELWELARLQREQQRVLDSLRVAMGERLGLQQQAYGLARELGQTLLAPDAVVLPVPSGPRCSRTSPTSSGLPLARGFRKRFVGWLSPGDPFAALGRDGWSRAREDCYKLLSAIAAPESGTDIGPGLDVGVQDLSPDESLNRLDVAESLTT